MRHFNDVALQSSGVNLKEAVFFDSLLGIGRMLDKTQL